MMILGMLIKYTRYKESSDHSDTNHVSIYGLEKSLTNYLNVNNVFINPFYSVDIQKLDCLCQVEDAKTLNPIHKGNPGAYKIWIKGDDGVSHIKYSSYANLMIYLSQMDRLFENGIFSIFIKPKRSSEVL
jgi:hypothetical protein